MRAAFSFAPELSILLGSMSRSLILLCVFTVSTAGRICPAQSPAVQQLYEKAHADQEAGKDDQAVADYHQLLRLDPSIAPAYNNLGRLLYNLGRFPEAVLTLRQGLAIDPKMAPANVMLGAAYFQLGEPEHALAPLETGVRSLPSDRFAHMTLARVLLDLKRPADAVVQLNLILKTDPRDQEAWYLLGKLHLELSQQAFTQVQAIGADTPLAHELAGEIMESMQNTPGAIDAYKQAISSSSPQDASALEHLANLYWTTGDWAHARQELTTLVAKQPGNCMAHWKLANSLDELGEPAEAGMMEVNRALEICPSLPQAHAERARLLLRTKQPAKALPDLEIAEKAAPDEPLVQRLFAQAYRALGDQQHALAADQRFQKLEAAEHAAKEQHAARVVQSNR